MKPIVIFGPTASGKSALAVALARAVGGEVVNADSRQVYRGIPIISACPSASDYAAVPHHLFEFIDVSEKYSAGRYAGEAAAKMAEVRGRGAVPVVVGGTGFYLKALMRQGSAGAPEVAPDVLQGVQQRLKNEGIGALAAEIRARDPEAAAMMDLANPQRVVRAVAVMESTGKTFSSFKVKEDVDAGLRQHEGDFLCVGLNPPVEELNARIGRRWRAMLEAGVVEEVRRIVGLWDYGITGLEGKEINAPGLQAVGVREIGAFLDGELSWDEAEARYLAAMRQYAKRQRTWLRNSFPAGVVFTDASDLEGMIEKVTQLLSEPVTQ
jgi:tRNA dimethylallyltransferase